MKLYKPKFYTDFHCIAAACPDSCCKEWEVDIDPKTAAFYRSLPGDLGDRLRQVLRITEDGGVCMTIQNGRCPMWRQDGLCRIQAELGHDALSTVCQEYPRMRHDYGDFMELGLELSCPEAARLIFSSNYEMEISFTYMDTQPTYDTDLMETLLQSRREVLFFLDTSPLSLPQRLAAILLYAHDVQNQIDGGKPAVFQPNRYLEEAKKYAQTGNFSLLTDFFLGLEILTPQWATLLKTTKFSPLWDDRITALARYCIYRYWLQAVSDYDLICRVKFIIVACLLVNALDGDPVCTAQLFSKEIENDPDNIDAILDGAYTAPAFTDVHLLSLLLGT